MFEILLTTFLVPFHCLLNISLVLDHNLFVSQLFFFCLAAALFHQKIKKIIIIFFFFFKFKSQQNLIGKEKESSQPLEIGHNNNKTREEK